MEPDSSNQISYSALGKSARSGESVITRLMADKLANPELLSLAAGFTDNRVLPEMLVREAMERLVKRRDRAYLQYGMNRGRPDLRECIVDLLRTYPGEENLRLSGDDVVITNGSQQGLYILVQMLCNPGDFVLVQSPSYFVFLELLQGLGVKAVSIPGNPDGSIDGDGFKSLLEKFRKEGNLSRVKLVYLMGAFANPSTRCISEQDKRLLNTILGDLERKIPLVEDMAYRELYFDQPYPARSLLAMEEWNEYPVIYAGTFTKPFATGLKTGFIATRSSDCLTTLAKIKGHQDFGSAHFNQAIIAEVYKSGKYHAHLDEIRGHYKRKRDLLEHSLKDHGLDKIGWRWQQPEGGLLLWAFGPEGFDTRIGSGFYECSLRKQVMYVPGDLCFAEGKPANCVRLSFGALEGELIPEAARRFCEAAAET